MNNDANDRECSMPSKSKQADRQAERQAVNLPSSLYSSELTNMFMAVVIQFLGLACCVILTMLRWWC